LLKVEKIKLTNEAKVIRISRLLTPDRRADLLAWVHLAYVAENSVRKSLGSGSDLDSDFILKSREYSCEKNLR